MLFNHLLDSAIDTKQILHQIRTLTAQIQQLHKLDEILNIFVNEARKTLKSDRVIIYRLLPDGDGVIAEESVNRVWKPILGQLIHDPCFQAKWVEKYQQGWVSVIEDINVKQLAPCYKKLLQDLQIRANLVVPILVNEQKIGEASSSSPQLWGLLIAHQCSSPRHWNALEIEYFQLLATQLGAAIWQIQCRQRLNKLIVQSKLKPRPITTTLAKNSPASITKETSLSKHISVQDLMAFERLQTPIWIYDFENLQMWWANSAALEIWNAKSLEELLSRNFSDFSEPTRIRVQSYVHQFQQGKSIAENWTLYPKGQPVSVHCLCSGIEIKPGRMAMLVEGITQAANQIEQKTLRSIEALRHTSLMISLYTMDGVTLMQNPAALHCYEDSLHPTSSTENAFLAHFVDKNVGLQAMKAMNLGEVFGIETQVMTRQGIRSHRIDIRPTRDPVTGNLMILVNENDISERIQAETALRESEQRYRSVITAMAEGVVLQTADGHISACNDSARRILGLTADQMMGRTSIDPRWQAIHEDGSAFPGDTHPAIVTLRTGQPQFNVVMGVYKPDGNLSWISINSQPLLPPNCSKPYAVVTSFTDITAYKQAQLALQQQAKIERIMAAIAQNIRQSLDLNQILHTTVTEVRKFFKSDRVIIYRCHPDEGNVIVSDSIAEHCLQTHRQSHQQTKCKAISEINNSLFADSGVQLQKHLPVKGNLVVSILQGDRLWGRLVVHHCNSQRAWQTWEYKLLEQLATQLAIAIQQSELYHQLQLANKQLKKIAMVDQLTQIANRRYFDSKLKYLWQYFSREKGCVSLLLCDIDFFKQYNDTYGHAAGDDCLRLVAEAVQSATKRSTDLAARYGGEEFAVILPNTDSNGAFQVAQEIHQAIEQLNIPHTASAVKPHVTLSIGIATMVPTLDKVTLELIEAADQALYQAKAQGRDRSCMMIINAVEAI